MSRRKPKYVAADTSRNVFVVKVRSANAPMFIARPVQMRKGYEAELWMLVRTSIAERLVTVETERMADWELSSIHSLELSRFWKYGAAARNMFLRGESRQHQSRSAEAVG